MPEWSVFYCITTLDYISQASRTIIFVSTFAIQATNTFYYL